jgi:hypothetical protein
VFSLPLISIALLAAGAGWALALLARSGETRISLVAGALALLALAGALPQIAAGAPAHAQLLELVGGIAGAAGGALAACGVAAFARTLRERDRAEMLHWEGMEAVRALGALSDRPGLDLQEKLATLLRAGCGAFGLEIGLVARASGERFEVVAWHGPPLPGLARGSVLPLAGSWCERTLAAGRPLAITDSAASSSAEHLARATLGLQAWLGAAIPSGGERFGALAFAARAPLARPLTATDKDLVALMARFVGLEIDRAVAAELVRAGARAARTPAPAAQAGRRSARGAGLDLNAALRRLDRELRSLAGPRVHVALRLAPGLRVARADPLPLRSVLLSLAAHALEGVREGGELRVETANLAAPGAAGAEPGFVTLTVRASGTSLAGVALGRVFESQAARAPGPGEGEGWLALPALQRLLQRCGGDLSIDVEPGRASAFTLFLRAAPARSATPERAAAAAARGAQPS